MMLLSWIPSKMHVNCAIITYAALAMVTVLLITPAMSAPLPSAATEQVSPPSSAQPSSPKSSKKKGNVAPPATDETVKVSSKLKIIFTHYIQFAEECMHVHGFSKFDKAYLGPLIISCGSM